MKAVTQLFQDAYNQTEKVIAYDPSWANGTGYFDHAVRADLGLHEGEMAKAVTSVQGQTQRLLILIGTKFGNVVVFQRYSAGQDDIYVFNGPQELRSAAMLPDHTHLNERGMQLIVGDACEPNVGVRLRRLRLALEALDGGADQEAE